jgi:hypothetical protein
MPTAALYLLAMSVENVVGIFPKLAHACLISLRAGVQQITQLIYFGLDLGWQHSCHPSQSTGFLKSHRHGFPQARQ